MLNSELPSRETTSPSRRAGAVRAGAMLAVLMLLALIPLFWPKPQAEGSGAGEEPVSRPAVSTNLQASLGDSDETRVAIAEHPADLDGAPKPAAVEPEPMSEDERHRRIVLGQWTQYDHGPRLLTVKEDGTGTMVVEPDGAWAYVIGAKVTMDVEWKIENGTVLFKSVRGTPETAFKAITQLFGSERNREISELTDKKLVLLDPKDGSKSEWKRVE